MKQSTLASLECPKKTGKVKCAGKLKLKSPSRTDEVLSGEVVCEKCKSEYPILLGVLILSADLRRYFLEHVKGISKFIPNEHIPKTFRKEFVAYKNEIETEHIEEDLESDRVNSLYLMNHYLDTQAMLKKTSDPLMKDLIKRYWDHAIFNEVDASVQAGSSVLELGCGVGGLASRLVNKGSCYLGVDSSFQSILIARHLNLSTPYPLKLKTPKDLLAGNHAEPFVSSFKAPAQDAKIDFIVCDIEGEGLRSGLWDYSVSLNTIDMLEEPKALPILQMNTLKAGGIAIQTGPYIWHERIAKKLRAQFPKSADSSSKLVCSLYESQDFEVKKEKDHLPWLFFKHARQLEVYSVHFIFAKKLLR